MEMETSSTLTPETLFAMLKSKNPKDVEDAERAFQYLGSYGVVLLLIHANNTRYKLDNRLRFLRLARSIGVEDNPDITSQLELLLTDKHREIVVEATTFLCEICPETAAFTVFRSAMRKPINIREMKKRLKSRWG